MNSKLHIYLLNSVIILSAIVAIATIILLSNYVFGQGPQTSDSSLFPDQLSSEFITSESDTLPPTLISDVNGPELAEIDSSTNLGLPELNFLDINGTYINPNIGFQLDLPKDWKGKEIKFLNNTVFVTPKEINFEIGDLEEPGTFMTILGIDKETFNLINNITQSLNGTTQLPSLKVGAEEAETASLQDSNLLNTTTTLKKVVTCKEEIPSSFLTINGINAEQMSQECTDGQETNVKTKTYAFTTAENSIIILTLSSNSINDYDQYLPQFKESVKTIKMSNPGDIATSQIYKKYKELESKFNQDI